MMGVGPMSGGGYSSSSNSNLSALAAPFTVERQSPNPYPSNPNLHYSASSYGIKPYSQQWDHYASPSAPVTEVPIDSTEINNQPPGDDYRYKDSVSQSPSSGHFSGPFSAPTAGAKYIGGVYDYGAKVDPYYPPFVLSSIREDDISFWDEGSRYNFVPSSGISLSSQADYSGGLLDFESKRRYVDGSGYGNNNQVDLDGNFLSLKLNDDGLLNEPYQGGGRTYGDKSREDYGRLYQHDNDVSSREITAGPFSVGNLEDDSQIEKLLGFIPYESNGANLAGCSFNYPQPRPSIPSFETPKSFSSYHNAFDSYEKCHRTVDSPFTGVVSVSRSSPAVVIRPPPATDFNLPQANFSHEAAPKDDAAGSHWRNFYDSASLRQKDPLLNLGGEMKGNSLQAKIISDQLLLSSSIEKLPTQLLAEGTLDKKIGGKSESKMSYMNASDGSPGDCENIKVAKSKEVIDNQNTAVDSPCWRGAPPSQFSLFDVEVAISNPFNKLLKGSYGVHHEELENLTSAVDSAIARSEKVESNENGEKGVSGNSAMPMFEQIFGYIDSGREASLWHNTEAGVEVSTLSSNRRFQICDDPNISGKNSNLQNDLKIGSDIKTSSAEQFNDENNAAMTLNDVPEGGGVTVHAAEKVPSSRSSQEDAECSNLLDPKLNIPVVIKAMCNLSELVLCHVASDAFSLDDESAESLRRTISNLKSYMSKQIAQESNETHMDIPVRDILGVTEEPVNMVNLSRGHATREVKNSHVQHGNKYLPDEKRNYRSVIRKDEKTPVASPLMDELDISRSDDVTKAINRILEEDFHFDEEIHPQALLYKNLWLESEAELCSIGYRARFDRMRNRMEKTKADALQRSIGVENCAEKMMPRVDASPGDSNGFPSQGLEACDITAKKSTRQLNVSTPSPSGHVDDIDASVMDRFNILKSRGEYIKTFVTETQQQSMIGSNSSGVSLAQLGSSKWTKKEGEQESKMVDDAQSVTSRFDILKSREDSFKSDNVAEKFQMKMIDDGDEQLNPMMAHYHILKSREDNFKSDNAGKFQMKMIDDDGDDEQVDPIMARYHILKSRDEDSNVNNMEKAEMGDGEYAGIVGGQSETQTTPNVVVEPYFSCPRECDFGPCGYESLKEYTSLKSYKMLNPIVKGKNVNEDPARLPDSSSSDWEHVQKDEFSCNNY